MCFSGHAVNARAFSQLREIALFLGHTRCINLRPIFFCRAILRGGVLYIDWSCAVVQCARPAAVVSSYCCCYMGHQHVDDMPWILITFTVSRDTHLLWRLLCPAVLNINPVRKSLIYVSPFWQTFGATSCQRKNIRCVSQNEPTVLDRKLVKL